MRRLGLQGASTRGAQQQQVTAIELAARCAGGAEESRADNVAYFVRHVLELLRAREEAPLKPVERWLPRI